jgi:predicted HTH transcriptional regulator
MNSQGLIMERIKERESSKVELKASFRYDMNNKKSNSKVLEKVIAKTIAAFMNAEGGTLFIGVDDESNPVGLQNDYETLKNRILTGLKLKLDNQ